MIRSGSGKVLFTLSVAAVALVVFASACRKQGGGTSGASDLKGKLARGEKIVVGFSQMENNGPWRIAETKSMRDEGAKRAAKYDLLVTDAQAQLPKQVSDVEDLIARGVDVIFLAPQQEQGFESALQSAHEKNIPVFLIDREVQGQAGQDFVCFLGSDFLGEGER